MSEQLGAEGVVQVMNDVFQIIQEEVDGEILKFIGDALLLIFLVKNIQTINPWHVP